MRLIDADALQSIFNATTTELLKDKDLQKDIEHVVRACLMTTEMIKDAPTVDAVEVVRCKDCKHYSVEGETTRFGWCGYWNKPTDEMRYCSDGERSKE